MSESAFATCLARYIKRNISKLPVASKEFAVNYIDTILRESKEKFTRLVRFGIKSVRQIFKTKMLMFQSKLNLDQKTLFKSLIPSN